MELPSESLSYGVAQPAGEPQGLEVTAGVRSLFLNWILSPQLFGHRHSLVPQVPLAGGRAISSQNLESENST